MLAIGTMAPDFTLYATPDQTVSLREFRGKRLIITFYPADWSPVCGDQMALYNESLVYLHRWNAQLVGISVDGKWCHLAFSQDRKIRFPLLADFEPKGEVSKSYDAYDTQLGECKRAIYILDETGVICWCHLSPKGINPGVDGILDALENMEQSKNNLL